MDDCIVYSVPMTSIIMAAVWTLGRLRLVWWRKFPVVTCGILALPLEGRKRSMSVYRSNGADSCRVALNGVTRHGCKHRDSWLLGFIVDPSKAYMPTVGPGEGERISHAQAIQKGMWPGAYSIHDFGLGKGYHGPV